MKKEKKSLIWTWPKVLKSMYIKQNQKCLKNNNENGTSTFYKLV